MKLKELYWSKESWKITGFFNTLKIAKSLAWTLNLIFYLFFSFRNPCIQLFYGFVITGGTAIYTVRVIPFFNKINVFSIATYILIAVNVTLFWICSKSDPGIITTLDHAEYMNDYEPDGVYYTQPECYTCKLIKPARSKHCCK